MKLTTFTVSAILAMANACNTELWGQGTCDYPLETASGNGAPITEEVVLALGACFESVFGGTGPYTLDGISLPDAGGTGTAWGVSMVIDGVSRPPKTSTELPERPTAGETATTNDFI